MPELIIPTVAAYEPWLECHREWGPGHHEDGFGLGPDDDATTPEGFAAWLRRLGTRPAAASGRHRCTYRWIVDGGRIAGGIALRIGDDHYTAWAGHVGYGIRPSARGRGLATWALGQVLELARSEGLTEVVAVCAVDNAASVRTIERNGGVFEGTGETRFGPVRRFRFRIGPE